MYKCDFCSAPTDGSRRFRCKDFVIEWAQFKNVGDFCTCAICESLVNLERWDDLRERSVNTDPLVKAGEIPRLVVEQFVKELHQKFRDNRL